MAKFCVVAPPQILEKLHDLGHYHLLLAHDIVSSSKRVLYHRLFRHRDAAQESNYELVILDNSVVELGTAVKVDTIVEAANIVRPTCVVLPDVMTHGKQTTEASLEAHDIWYRALREIPGYGPQLMVIPQGKDIYEFTRCAESLKDLAHVKFWGCPRNLVQYLGTRRDAIQILNAMNPRRKIHMFGFSDNMLDDIVCARMKEVYSIDSAVPIRIHDWSPTIRLFPPRGDWWETGQFDPQIVANIKYARQLFNRE